MGYEIIIPDMNKYSEMSSEEKKKIFTTDYTISGGDIAAIMGVNPYENNVQLYNRKIKFLRKDLKPSMLRGMDYEKGVKFMFKWEYEGIFKQTGFTGMIKSIEKPYITGVPDDILICEQDIDMGEYIIPAGEKILHEIKSKFLQKKETGYNSLYENLQHYINYLEPMYEVQMQLYMWIMELKYGLYTICGVTAPFKSTERHTQIGSRILVRDDERIKQILTKCDTFYRHLLSKDEPALYQRIGGI